MLLELFQYDNYKLLGISILIIFGLIFIKVLIEEIIKFGFKGIFIGLPKALFWIIYYPIAFIYKKIKEME